MKLSVLLFFATLLSIQANNSYSQETHISLVMANVTVERLLETIENDTEFKFVYKIRDVDLKRKVSIEVANVTIDKILDQLFKNSNTAYKIMDRQVFLIPKRQVNKLNAIPLLRNNFGYQRSIPLIADTIRGRVTDERGEALIGVNIQVEGTTKGTATDFVGEFELDNVPANAVLIVSYIGYQTREVPVSSSGVMDIILQEDSETLEEVVVIGFGERKKKDLTGSISTVGAEVIEKIGSISPQFALQGNTTGVRVINASGDPNEAPQIFVRGIGTWNGDSQPLYVVDGQIIEPPRAGNEDVISGFGLSTPPNLFNLINPNDIESISVLKDASAAAIYGSRAANGVVLITTKRGRSDVPVVEMNSTFGVQNIPTFDLLTTPQFISLAEEMYTNSNNPDVDIIEDLYGRYEPSDANRLTSFSPQFDPQSPFYISNRNTYDWQDELVNKNAFSQDYDVKVSGATDRLDYYISGGLSDRVGVIYGDELRRYTGAVNFNIDVTDWITLGVNYKFTHQRSFLNGSQLQEIADVSPWQPLRDPNHPSGYAPVIDPFLFGDTWQGNKIYGQGSNPNYLAIADINTNAFTIKRNLGQFYAEVSPFKSLTFRGSLNLDYTIQDRFSLDLYPQTSYFSPAPQDPRTVAPNAPNSNGRMSHRINNIFNYQTDFTAIYDKVFANKHNLNITAAVQDQRHQVENSDFNGANLLNINKNPFLNGFSGDLSNNNSFYGWTQRFWFGMVGRVSYNYDSRYYIDASYRRDASNGFDDEYRWGNFYAISGAWRLSDEPFFNIESVSDLKIRGGWGQAGNDQAAVGRYAFLSRAAGGLSSTRWGSGNGNPIGNQVFGALVADFPNPELSWEVSTTTNIGFDALLFNYHLNISAEWYSRVTSGILQSVNLPISVGTNNPLFNIGEMENKGIDLIVGYQDQKGDFYYGVSGNISFVRNKVTKLYQGQPLSVSGFERADAVRVEEGRSVGVIWGYKLGGIFQSQTEIDAYFSEMEDNNISNLSYVQPGDMYFLDVQGDPTEAEPFYSLTPDGKINSNDQTEIGNTIPGYTYGLSFNLGWKGLDLSFNFYGEGDVEKYNEARRRFESMSGAGTNYFSSTLNRWTPSNTDTDMPRAVIGDPAGNNRFSSRWVESAAFFRLNNWQVGYTLPPSVMNALGNTVRSLRLFVGGQNNLYIHKWGALDPVNDAIPLPRVYNAGLNVKF
ncbi:MAG TPA: TonB-dependent receptor [Membranihabitans sp.]|nr:TonB-dependent receptor [Membranihabitans sp.]